MNKIYDFIGIGIGPFNLGLACLAEPIDGLDCLFLDRAEGFNWHPGMMLDSATLQTPFMADLVTLADPTSRFSFLNYAKQIGRLYAFYIKEDFFLMRREYNQYCQWVVEQLDSLRFGHFVQHVDYLDERRCYRVRGVHARSGEGFEFLTRRLVLGTGTTPYLPSCCEGVADHVSHSGNYLQDKPRLQGKRSITVVGSGQSAAEIYYDLLQEIDRHDYQLNWITRAPRFFPLEYTKLTLEMTSPEYIDYFHSLPRSTREKLIDSQKGLYKGINGTLINAIYDELYNQSLKGEVPTQLLTNAELRRCQRLADGALELEFFQHELQQSYRHRCEALVMASGYQYRLPRFIQPIAERIVWQAPERFAVARNYSIDRNGGEVFVQNAGLADHGLVTPDLGMGCYRNACILREICGHEHYAVETKIAFQQFSLPQPLTPQGAVAAR
ncbi:SidA/IucD/PvdA family monooxygenase [Pseudomonas stutzeri]|uniref:lysine N(6)-hydroxylase/L-ornithine N(5)-oxygenase family protein n=1 Tax=Stutzerimonas stutzeri TaxID=316 RepID=UPI001E5162A3|nr:SidA/IucD/PvdA family monooxygenase [Stutzerimonas stutzeri]MCC8343568.1 SidA/IucD/PvdA family monooxygenase [Stutzerimonas stutzeri]